MRRAARSEPAVRSTSGSAEGERLAGARRRLGEDVEAGERVREDEALNGEGFGDPLPGERAATGALTPSS